MPLHSSAWVLCSKAGSLPTWSWGSFQSHLLCGSAQRHAVYRIWGRVPSFGPRRLLGHWYGRSGWRGCSSTREAFAIEQMGEMEVSVPIKCGRKPPGHSWALQSWCTEWPSRWRGRWLQFCSPPWWLVPPSPAWFCHVPFGVTWPGRPSRSWHPWWL